MSGLRTKAAVGMCLSLVIPHVPAGTPITPSQVYRQVSPSVCAVEGPHAVGTAFAVDDQGIFATNAHVLIVDGTDRIRCGDRTGRIEAVIASHDKFDLVLFQTDLKGVPALPLGRASAAEPGTTIFVIGNPLGLDLTMSPGLVAALPRQTRIGPLLQITAPISPGSSGGPVVTQDAVVIGIATATLSEGQNLNFAVPAELIDELDRERMTMAAYRAKARGNRRAEAPRSPGPFNTIPMPSERVTELTVNGHAMGSSCSVIARKEGIAMRRPTGNPLSRDYQIRVMTSVAGQSVTLGPIDARLAYICDNDTLVGGSFLLERHHERVMPLLKAKYGDPSLVGVACRDRMGRPREREAQRWLVAESLEIILVHIPLGSVVDFDTCDVVNRAKRLHDFTKSMPLPSGGRTLLLYRDVARTNPILDRDIREALDRL